MAYLFIILSSVCSLTIAHLLKLTEVKELRTLNTLTVNYIVAAVFALVVDLNGSGTTNLGSQTTVLLIFCGLVGAFFISNFVVYGKSVHTNGVGITIASMRMSLLIPVLISVFFYVEYLDGVRLAGVVLVFGAMALLVPKKNNKLKVGSINASWLLLIIFVLSGFADASLKIYQEEFSTNLNELTFMGMIFVGAFIIGLLICIFREGPIIRKKEAMLGAVIGIPNLYSSIFLIYALDGISGSVAYPIVNILNVLGGTFLGLLVWNDKVSYKQWAGIAAAIIAILLLI
ncbi:EamA-like transporter family protein [Fodinibius salinus]|uniref:EamA-like transporter family protein n=1 Tax=Fodinibius salinus TaxID=860790 RepID=A0A5D3YNE4_9BACT|nr:EamA family transporter [Fodinibius salinus]TYP95202.1 EamA-like transporter family protein [Fodinibius salinus]